jgi:hypothetical protein
MALCPGCVGWGEDPPVLFMTYPEVFRESNGFLKNT